jgi:hypothetical protein
MWIGKFSGLDLIALIVMKSIKTPSDEEYFILKKVNESDSRKKIRKKIEIILQISNG